TRLKVILKRKSRLKVCCALAHSKPICDQTEFLHPNGTCVACPVCKPGDQLSGDCGFGDGGEHVCIPCDDGTFSSDTDVAPCRRCTQCSLLNRHLVTACSPTRDGLCGQCLPGSAPLGSTNCIYTCCVVFSRMNDLLHLKYPVPSLIM
uniref:TNFR-Cys domain-containing protein n=1 Tax=Oryzias melastigma TaxID=30732 RepID=A0A3B3D434_ORYME